MLSTTKALASHVDDVVDGLGRPERCGDAAYLAATVPPPDDPVVAREVEAQRAQLAKIDALLTAGQKQAAKALVAPVIASADHVGYEPLVARARFVRGRTSAAIGDYAGAFTDLHDAYFTARTGHDEATAAACASSAALALLDLSRDAEAVDWAHLAEVDAGATSDPVAEEQAIAAIAVVTKAHGDPKRALAYAEQYLALARRLDCSVPEALRARSAIRDVLGDYPGALADLDAAGAEVQRRYGEHPMIADLERERALVLLHLHRVADAAAAARHGVDIAERLEGKDSVAANNAVATLAVTLKDAKLFDEALVAFDQSIARDDPHSYNLASDLNNKGDLQSQLHHIDDALATWTASREMFAEVVGADGNEVGIVELNIWNGLYEAGRTAEGAPHVARALSILATTPDSALYAQALIAQGMTEVEGGDPAHAKDHLTAGLAKLDDDPRWRIRGRVALAKVLARTDRAAARTLLATAREDARTSGEVDPVPEIERLLARMK